MPPGETIEETRILFAALADRSRLKILRALLECRKDGTMSYYSLRDESASKLAVEGVEAVEAVGRVRVD